VLETLNTAQVRHCSISQLLVSVLQMHITFAPCGLGSIVE